MKVINVTHLFIRPVFIGCVTHKAAKATDAATFQSFLPRDASAERGDATVSCPSVRL